MHAFPAVTLAALAFVNAPPHPMCLAGRAVAVSSLPTGGAYPRCGHGRGRGRRPPPPPPPMGGSTPTPSPPAGSPGGRPPAPLIEVELMLVVPPGGAACRRLVDGVGPPAVVAATLVDVYYEDPAWALTVADTWLRTGNGGEQLKHPLPAGAAAVMASGTAAAAAHGAPGGGGGGACSVDVDEDHPGILAALG